MYLSTICCSLEWSIRQIVLRYIPYAIENGYERIRLGAGGRSSRGIRNRCVVRSTSAQSDTLGPILDCGGLCMVHIEMAAAVESFSSTEMLDSISTDFSGLISCYGVRFSISIKMHKSDQDWLRLELHKSQVGNTHRLSVDRGAFSAKGGWPSFQQLSCPTTGASSSSNELWLNMNLCQLLSYSNLLSYSYSNIFEKTRIWEH